ncbi:MAG: CpsD/CapB family tyrosine-protein kinase [Anaerolineae bacterium]|nr:CpsD/CapB family tyrosine-protein kinase [Anaerolineae bacterium]MCX8067513.1 CpsD/CapB family tyrosine-protein kinase [Anaerolineae bacterium]MDW7991968.1 CpsD/CapB family tyrosine-protein kinase [Anaerolineae bacterium]
MSRKPPLITLTDPRSPAAEAYRTLRTNLTFAGLDQPLEALVVTSPALEDEKSVAAANLAVTMAQGERRTILVDADLRRPRLHEIFGVSNGQGLTTMFVEPEAMADPPLVDVGVENLWLLPSGPLPPNPADLLGSRRMDEVLAALRARADILLFDAPPVIAVTDAVVLGRKADGVLLVMTAGRTRRDHALAAKEILERAQIRLVGVVLTNVPLSQARRYY